MNLDISSPDALPLALEAVRDQGYAIIEGVLDTAYLSQLKGALDRAQAAIHAEIGHQRLQRAGELGVVRNPFGYDPLFFGLLAQPTIVEIADRTVSETSILHLMNGFVLPSYPPGESPSVFQNRFHRDFPRHLNGYVASINIMIAVDGFRADNGATLVVPGSHQRAETPATAYMDRAAVPAECPAGSLVVFDSTLWHAAGANVSGQDRYAINLQFTRSWIKQQIDYVRALGTDLISNLPERSQQMLGMHTRVVTSLDEYYRPAEQRLYRSGQG